MADAQAQIAQAMRAFMSQLQPGQQAARKQVEANPMVQRLQQMVARQVAAPIQPKSPRVSVPVAQPPVEGPSTEAEAAAPQPPAAVMPPTMGHAVTDLPERVPTEEEQLQRIQELGPTELGAFLATPSGQITKELMTIRQQENEQRAKTELQKESNAMFMKILAGKGDDMGLQHIKSTSYNPTTGNLTITTGRPTSEEQRALGTKILVNAVQKAKAEGTPVWQTIAALRAQDDSPISFIHSDEIQTELELAARNDVSALIQNGVPMRQAVQQTFFNYGVIPDDLKPYLPAEMVRTMEESKAREEGQIMAQLTDRAGTLRNLENESAAALDMAKRINEFNAPEKPSQKDQDAFNAGIEASMLIEDINKVYGKDMVGVLRGRVPVSALAFFGQLKGGEAKLDALVNRLSNAVIRLTAGLNQTQNEVIRSFAVLPRREDDIKTFVAKLRLTAKYTGDLLRLRQNVMAQSGRRFRGSFEPKTITVNGQPIEVMDVVKTSALKDIVYDPSMLREWDTELEKQAGIHIDARGNVRVINPDTGEELPLPDVEELRKQAGVDTGSKPNAEGPSLTPEQVNSALEKFLQK